MDPDISDADRRCGLRGCREPVVPAAFIEGQAWIAGALLDVRVEVCAGHYDLATGDHLTVEATR